MTATRWSSDFVIAEYRDLKAKTISLDNSGNFIFIPGKTQLAVKNLSLPLEEITLFPKVSKHEPGAAAWNPHNSYRESCALVSGIQVDLLTFKNNAELFNDRILKSHTRVVTGLNWHPMDPNLLATTSLDTFTFIWDIRESMRPAISLPSFAAASHVKWNKLSRHLLATVHGGDVKVWDKRKMSSPIQYISAHLTSIHCIDWSPCKENQFCTSSQDGTIKFFDTSYPRKTECVINAEAPVWRAAYTPFGRGLLVIVIPTAKKVENTLLLWNLSNNSIPLHTFVGHSEIILDFQWRYFPRDGSDYQLITWSKDQTLRIWEVDRYLQELCGPGINDLDIGEDCVDFISEPVSDNSPAFASPISDKSENSILHEKERYPFTSDVNGDDISNELPKIFIKDEEVAFEDEQNVSNKASTVGSFVPVNLQQEFSSDINIPNVQILKTDIIRRMCCASAKCNGQVVSLLINFPPSYPRNKSPIFRFASGTSVSNAIRFKILEALRDTADFKVKNNQACLEACLRTLIITMQQLTSNESEKVSLYAEEKLSNYGNNQDACFLAARTCGAKFCFVDRLICFARPLSQLQNSDKNICGLVNLSNRQTELLTKMYLQNKSGMLPPRTKYMIRRGLLKRMKDTRQNKRIILIYDVSSLFFLNKELAFKYKLAGSDITNICKHNAQVANSSGRKDLQQIWNLVLISVRSFKYGRNDVIDWDCHPLAKQMLHSIILFYISQSDLQTAASLCCVFQPYLFKSEFNQLKRKSNRPVVSSPTVSVTREQPSESDKPPCHMASEPDKEYAWSYPSRNKHVRSSSWSEFLEDVKSSNSEENSEISDSSTDLSMVLSSCTKTLKDQENFELFERVKRAYADILYRWQLLCVRTSVMKNVQTEYSDVHKGLEFRAKCDQCKNATSSRMCTGCQIPAMYCAICRLSVKGLAYACAYCGHGGHLSHMKKWYETKSYCPVGCKCQCSYYY